MQQPIFYFIQENTKRAGIASFSVLLCLFGLMTSPSIANRPVADDPPPNTRGRSAGSRGCNITAAPEAQSSDTPAIILLAPERDDDGVSQTLSTQPTFVWFNRDGNDAVQTVFRLYEYNAAAQDYRLLVESQGSHIAKDSGIVLASLPDEMAELAVGSRYLWQVGLLCDPNRPSGDLFAEAEFEVVAPSSALASQLAAMADSPADKAALLAANDLWYDALPLAILNTGLMTGQGNAMEPVRQALFETVAFSADEQSLLSMSPLHRIELTQDKLGDRSESEQ